jgi:tetratricopeptide (TPR) repeat protein
MPTRKLLSIATILFISLVTNQADLLADLIGGQGALIPGKPAADGKQNPLAPAIAAFEKQDFAEFQREYRLASIHLPLPAEEVFWSRLLIEAGLIPQAIATLEAYQQSTPTDPEIYVTFGFLAMKTARWTDAQLQFEKAESLVSDGHLPKERNSDVMPGLVQFQAEVALNKQRWDSAESLFRRLKELLPDDPLPAWKVGFTQVLSGRIEEGIETMKTIRTNHPELPCPHLTVANSLIQTKPWLTDSEAAKLIERQFREAILSGRENVEPWREYLKWLLMLDRSQDVVKYLDKAPESIQKLRDPLLLRAIAYRSEQKFTESEAILEELLKAKPDDVEVSDQLILVLLQSSDSEKKNRAKAMAEENLKQFPEIENVIATAGWASLCFDEMQKADELLSRLLQRGGMSPQSAYFVGQLLEKLNRNEEANRVFQMAIGTTGIFPERTALKAQMAAVPQDAKE